MRRVSTALQAVSSIKSGHRVFIHGAAATPNALVEALTDRAEELRDVELIHLHTFGPARYADPQYAKSFRVANLFVGNNLRGRFDRERVDYIPIFLSEIPYLFRSRARPLDVAMIMVSPPDRHGNCTLGTSVDCAAAAVEAAPMIIAQINPRMPRVLGDGVIHMSRFTAAFEHEVPLIEHTPCKLGEVERQIGRNVSRLVDDGATLQMGIGAIPEAVLSELKGHKDLGIHTEMWCDGALDLILCGAVNNQKKVKHHGRTVSTFIMGTQRLYDYVNDNAKVMQFDVSYVNQPHVISMNPKVTAINSAIEIDLTGQVCADSVGDRLISGVGGQMDFLRGAALSKGGKPIIAITSRAAKGASRIVPRLKHGSGVVTTRAHVRYVATEYGVVDLFGKTLHERAALLTSIAHPDDREGLERAWHEIAAHH